MTEQRGHITLSELQGRIESAVTSALPLPLWVCAEIAEMNYKVETEGQEPEDVATAFLEERGLLHE